MIIKCRKVSPVVDAVCLGESKESFSEVIHFLYETNVFNSGYDTYLKNKGVEIENDQGYEFIPFGHYLVKDSDSADVRVCAPEFFKKHYHSVEVDKNGWPKEQEENE